MLGIIVKIQGANLKDKEFGTNSRIGGNVFLVSEG